MLHKFDRVDQYIAEGERSHGRSVPAGRGRKREIPWDGATEVSVFDADNHSSGFHSIEQWYQALCTLILAFSTLNEEYWASGLEVFVDDLISLRKRLRVA